MLPKPGGSKTRAFGTLLRPGVFVLPFALAACGSGASDEPGTVAGEVLDTLFAEVFSVVERDGYRIVDIEASVVTWGGTAGGPPQLRALGVEDRIVAVGGHSSYDDGLRRMARSGEIQQIGYGWHMPPTLDALVAARPDVLVARMADLTHTRHMERVESLGIPVVPTFVDAEPH